jgi:TfoX/Sxy family transcriptional regulator of competence genes
MQMPKPTDEDKTRFAALVVEQPGVETKPMFGNLGAFVNGNMFMGLFGSQIGVKLRPEDQQELLDQPGAGPFGPAERPMGGYVALPRDWSGDQAAPWVEKAFAHVAALPPKKKKGA